VVGPAGDVFDQAVRALELGHDAQHGQQEPEVAGHRRLHQDGPAGQGLQLGVEALDGLVPLGQQLDHLVVAGEQGVGGPVQVLGQHAEQLDDPGLDGVQLLLEVLPVLRHGAQPIRPVT
jgi:hypothetical protein